MSHNDRYVTININVTVHDGDQTWRSKLRADDDIVLSIPAGVVKAIDYDKLITEIYSRASTKFAEAKREQEAADAATDAERG